jgi:hypothetical protein
MQPHALKSHVSKKVGIYLHNLLTSGVDGGEWPQVTLSKGMLHLRIKIAREPSSRRLDGPQWQSLRFRDQKNDFTAPGIELYFVHHLTCGAVTFT